MLPQSPTPRRRTRLLLVLVAAACSGCASLTGGPRTPSDNTASGGAPTVTEDNAATAAPAAATIGGTKPIPSGR